MTEVSMIAPMFDLMDTGRGAPGTHKVGDTVTIKFLGKADAETVTIESIEFAPLNEAFDMGDTLIVNGREVGSFWGMDAFRPA